MAATYRQEQPGVSPSRAGRAGSVCSGAAQPCPVLPSRPRSWPRADRRAGTRRVQAPEGTAGATGAWRLRTPPSRPAS